MSRQKMKAKLVRIGNSKGVRIPHALVRQYGLGDVVELEPQKGQIVIRPAQRPREGWSDTFRRLVENERAARSQDRRRIPTEGAEGEWIW